MSSAASTRKASGWRPKTPCSRSRQPEPPERLARQLRVVLEVPELLLRDAALVPLPPGDDGGPWVLAHGPQRRHRVAQATPPLARLEPAEDAEALRVALEAAPGPSTPPRVANGLGRQRHGAARPGTSARPSAGWPPLPSARTADCRCHAPGTRRPPACPGARGPPSHALAHQRLARQLAQRAPHARGLDAVRQPRARVVAGGERKHLRLVMQPPEGAGEDDAVVVPVVLAALVLGLARRPSRPGGAPTAATAIARFVACSRRKRPPVRRVAHPALP